MINKIIEKENKESKNIYLRCDCGGEIIGFHYIKWWDKEEWYYLSFYGNSNPKIKDNYGDFHFKSSIEVNSFIDEIIDNIQHNNNSEFELNFEDKYLDPKYLKKNGPSILNISIDRIANGIVDISKFKNKNLLNLKKPKCTWGIVVNLENFTTFLNEVKKIVNT